MFIDTAKIKIKAGDGGNGAVSFHREKYVAAGGPDGGDGGRGGDILFVADTNLSTLVDFQYKRKFEAPNGQPGGKKKCFGRSGQNLTIRVPQGTLVKDAQTGRIMADLSEPGIPVMVAKGGRGGWGNAHFATPTRQIPRFAKPGLPGQAFEVTLELKLLADVGLVGFPNAGKSTLISVVSQARPEIANYPFTTLTPVLGVVRIDEGRSFVMADIPGLIEGASAGLGLGHQFLRHVERCRLILHVIDAAGTDGRDPVEDFDVINRELQEFDAELASRPQIVAINKCDAAQPEDIERLRAHVEKSGWECFQIAAALHQGVEPLMQAVSRALEKLPPIKQYEPQELVEEIAPDERTFEIRHEDGVFEIEAPWLARMLSAVNIDDYESLQYFQRTLRSSGIIDKLEKMGVREGDTVRIADFEFEYVD